MEEDDYEYSSLVEQKRAILEHVARNEGNYTIGWIQVLQPAFRDAILGMEQIRGIRLDDQMIALGMEQIRGIRLDDQMIAPANYLPNLTKILESLPNLKRLQLAWDSEEPYQASRIVSSVSEKLDDIHITCVSDAQIPSHDLYDTILNKLPNLKKAEIRGRQGRLPFEPETLNRWIQQGPLEEVRMHAFTTSPALNFLTFIVNAFRSVKKLHLRAFIISNDSETINSKSICFSPKTLKAEQMAITELSLCLCYFPEEFIFSLIKLLSVNTSIKILNIEEANIYDHTSKLPHHEESFGYLPLDANNTIEAVSLTGFEFFRSHSVAQEFALLFRGSQSLRKLNLIQQDMLKRDDGHMIVHFLLPLLQSDHCIQELHLSYRAWNCHDLFGILSSNGTVQRLTLDCRELAPVLEGKALQECHLQHLGLKDIGVGSWMKLIPFVGRNCHLESLYVSCRMSTNQSGRSLHRLFDILSENRSLEALHLKDTLEGRDEGDYVRFISRLQNHPTMKSIQFENMLRLPSSVESLIAAAKDNPRFENIVFESFPEGSKVSELEMMLTLNRAGRRSFVEDPTSKAKWVDLLAGVSNDMSATFYLLSGNPGFFDTKLLAESAPTVK